ncbi:MAG TPA: universal stress protein [Candidatus Sulfotelmatobacter sp.]|nr:universal stress protein [Candidatus Sulfotelmatobacter sp.]
MTLNDHDRISRAATRIRKILVPTDFSENSNLALKCAMSFARRFKARIILLNVIEKQNEYPDVYYSRLLTRQRIKSAVEKTMVLTCRRSRLRKPLLQDAIVREGLPCRTICETAKDQKADLIIIATHGRTGLAHIFEGSVTEKVIRYAPCLVLVVRNSGNHSHEMSKKW